MTDADDEVRLEIFIAASPAIVFTFFTDPEKMRLWFGVSHRLEPRPGGVFRVDVNGGNIASGRFTELVPDRRIVFTWGYEAGGISGIPPGSTVVEIELNPEGEGTRVILTHRGLSGDAAARHRFGWTHYLARLAIAGAGGDPGRDPQIRGAAPETRSRGRRMMESHRIVARGDWLAARKELLAKEKDFTRLRDELARERRALPWVRVEKPYAFDAPDGRKTLADLFAGRSQLVIYHFMFDPSWSEGCKSCSFWADNFNPNVIHLAQRDVTMIAVSRAPLAQLETFKRRMGWGFAWVSSYPSDFNRDYHVSFTHEEAESGAAEYNFRQQKFSGTERAGVSVFFKDAAGAVFHTYSCYARGLDMMNTAYQILDLVPKGRDEAGLPSPQTWVRWHDRYGS